MMNKGIVVRFTLSLAGALGAAILDRILERGWAKRERASRLIKFKPSGERAFQQAFGIRR